MTNPTRTRAHGTGVRGADLSRGSTLFEGPFGRMFRALPPADFGHDDAGSQAALNQLAVRMTAEPDAPKDGPDAEESGIPAAFTYFGQFIDHDLTFDPASSLQRQNDPDALVDFRTPRLDLDSLYGRGPDDQPYLYEDGRRFLLGRPLTGAVANPKSRDLPRGQFFAPNGAAQALRAIIGDPRNDENVIVSQLQGLLLRLHNKIADAHATGADAWSFERVQREVRFHYQWVVLNDFLPTIVAEPVLKEVLPQMQHHGDARRHKPNLEFYLPRKDVFMPLEFSAAAYRFGHSMVRPGYRLSETVRPLSIFGPNPNQSLTGFREFPANWAIDWNLFIDLQPRDPDDTTRTQLAYRIDTSLANPLGNLPASIANGVFSLAARNLLRGWRLRLPSGQAVARAMGLRPLADSEIRIGKFTGAPGDIVTTIDRLADGAFRDNCPLWTYILAETVESSMALRTSTGVKHIKTRKLGPVGGRIVAETIVGILLQDSSSLLALDPLWTPSLAVKGRFGLRELIATALS